MLFYLVAGLILAFYFLYPKSRWEASVVLFVAFIMQTKLLGEGQQFLGFADQRTLVTGLVIFSAIVYHKWVIRAKDKLKSIIIFLAYFLIVFIASYIELKNGYIYNNMDWGTQLKRLAKSLIYLYATVLIIKHMHDERTLNALDLGLFFGVIIASSSMFFPDFYSNFGFDLHEGTREGASGNLLRLTGFLGLNANDAARVFNMVIGYVLAKNEKRDRFSVRHIVMLLLSTVAIMITASRTGIIILIIISILYILRTTSNVRVAITKTLLIIGGGLIIFNLFGGYMEERIQGYYTGESDTLTARISYWHMFMNDIIKNPRYLIAGNTGPPPYSRDVHNTYIQYLYFTGALVLIVVLNHLWRIFRLRFYYKKNDFYFNPIYILLTLIIAWSTGAGRIDFWFVLLIAASAGIPHHIVQYQRKVFNKK